MSTTNQTPSAEALACAKEFYPMTWLDNDFPEGRNDLVLELANMIDRHFRPVLDANRAMKEAGEKMANEVRKEIAYYESDTGKWNSIYHSETYLKSLRALLAAWEAASK